VSDEREREAGKGGRPVKGRADESRDRGTARLLDAEGNVVDAPEDAIAGELKGSEETKRRTWFLIEEVEFRWLPIRESALLLWVLVGLVLVWVGVAIGLRFF
jgi:hypothetical protein